eukprot:1157567-Pelagomonas_calceolata.AAC.4
MHAARLDKHSLSSSSSSPSSSSSSRDSSNRCREVVGGGVCVGREPLLLSIINGFSVIKKQAPMLFAHVNYTVFLLAGFFSEGSCWGQGSARQEEERRTRKAPCSLQLSCPRRQFNPLNLNKEYTCLGTIYNDSAIAPNQLPCTPEIGENRNSRHTCLLLGVFWYRWGRGSSGRGSAGGEAVQGRGSRVRVLGYSLGLDLGSRPKGRSKEVQTHRHG